MNTIRYKFAHLCLLYQFKSDNKNLDRINSHFYLKTVKLVRE